MNRGWKPVVAIIASITVVIAACDSKNYTAGIDRSGSPTAVVTKGPITGFGSVFINGVEYETNGTVITFNEAPATESNLAVGHIVTLRGTDNGDGTGDATEIEFQANVQGPVDSIDAAGNTLVVMGQRVTVDLDTTYGGFSPANIDGISVGQVVEVSGFVGATGVRATRVAALPANSPFETIGTVANLDPVAQSFAIGSLNVDYSTASLEDFPSGAPADGDEVEVEGTMIVNGTLVAQEVELRAGGLGGDQGEEGEVEGLITRFVDATDFDVDGITCTTNSQTVYEGGNEADLQLNVKIQVEGTFDSGGILVADEIEIKDGGAVQFVAQVEKVDTSEAQLAVGGRRIQILPNTRMEDLGPAAERYFSPEHLRVGDWVMLSGTSEGDSFVASSLRRVPPP